jgi:hypothetical protein
MPEYLAPGVYVEETSFRAKSIEGVATSTAGFVGQARFGPTPGCLVTGFEEFQRFFGDGNDLLLGGVPTTNHLARGAPVLRERRQAGVCVAHLHPRGGLGGGQPLGEPGRVGAGVRPLPARPLSGPRRQRGGARQRPAAATCSPARRAAAG